MKVPRDRVRERPLRRRSVTSTLLRRAAALATDRRQRSSVTGRLRIAGLDFGPRVESNRGVIDNLIPAVLTTHRVLVPQVDRIGNDVAGIRHPFVEAPIATLTGWNTRRPEFTAGDLCDLTGMTVPLKRTRAERLAAGDPRPSLEELYGTHAGYVEAVRRAAGHLEAQGLMLPEDAEQTIAEAEASDVLR